MASRTLETILTGKNELSPVLAKAAEDVAKYDAAATAANDSTAASAEKSAGRQKAAADQVAQANSKVKLSAEEAARSVGQVRDQLAELGGKKLGVDVDTVDARMQVAELRGKLDEVAASKPTARVQAETGAAEAQLRAIQAELNRIDGQRVTAKVDVDDSSVNRAAGSMGSLMGAAMGVAPALVPIGAAAVAGLGGIAGLAAAGVGGLGVLTVAIAGVANAVKLIGQQQDAAAAQSTKAAGSSVSSAAAIKSAEASLANVRANAADQAVTAAEAVQRAKQDEVTAERTAAQNIQTALDRQSQAEQALTTAQRDELTAQKDLTAARQTAKQQIEDLANQVTDNALAQRQSVLDVAAAKLTLDQALANPAATKTQREQAQIAYDQQVQQQKELALSGQRLAAQKADADAKGVAGADVVVAAQQKVADSQQKVTDAAKTASQASVAVDQARVDGAQKVADAQQKLSDAVRAQATQQRQAAFSIAQAQDAVTNAMHSSGSAGTSSLDAINKKLAELDPATRSFAEYLTGTWKPLWGQIKTAAAGGLLPGVKDGMDAVLPVMPQIIGLVGDLSGTLGGLASEAGHALAGPYWTQFFGMIRATAGPLLADLGHTLGNLAHGFAGVLEAFQPMSLEMGNGLVDLSGKFAAWGESLKSSDGFQKFVQYVHDEWPVVKAVIENVATAVEHLIQAGGILGGPTLQLLRVLSGELAGLPVPVVTALVAAFEGFKIFQTVTGPFKQFSDTLGKFAEKSTDAAGNVGKLGKAASGLQSALPVLGALATGVGMVTAAWQASSAQVDDWAKALLDGGQAASDATQQLADAHDRSILDAHSLSDAWGIVKGAFADGASEIKGYSSAQDEATQKAKALYDAMTPQQKAAQDVTTAQANLQQVLADPGHTAAAAAMAADALRNAQFRQQTQTDETKNSTKTLTDAIYDNVTATEAAAGSALGFQSSLMSTQGQIDKYTQGIKDGTLKVKDRKQAENDVSQAILQTVQAAGKQAEADNAGKSAADIHKASVDAQRDAYEKLVGRLGYVPPALVGVGNALDAAGSQAKTTSDKMYDLGLKVIGLPNDHEIDIKAPTEQQMKDLNALGLRTTTLPGGNVRVDADTKPAQDALTAFLNQQRVVWVGTMIDQNGVQRPVDSNGHVFVGPLLPTHKAAGGHVTGPGTGTSDSIPAYLSNGEFVVKAAQTAKHLPLLHAINDDAPGFADGGLVTPVQMDPAGLAAANGQILANAQQQALAAQAAFLYSVPTSSLANVQLGLQLASARGWGGMDEWTSLYNLWKRESGWRNTAQNPTSTAYGIPQFLDSTWATVGARKTSDPRIQITAGLDYIAQRFHDPIGAWAHESKFGWYGNGGIVNGAQLVGVGEDGPEAIVPLSKPDRAAAVLAQAGLVSYNAAGTGFTAAAAQPGYAAAGAGGIDYTRLAQAIAQAMPAGRGGPLFHADKVELSSGSPADIAQELAYVGRTRGW